MVLFLTFSHATYCSKGGWWTQTQILTKTELCHHHRNTTQSQHEKVRNQKCRCIKQNDAFSILVVSTVRIITV